jgi:hypothetical protein
MQDSGPGPFPEPSCSPVSVSVYLASNRDMPGVELKDLAQTAVLSAQWLALLTAPQSTNLPTTEAQRRIIRPHLSSKDLESTLYITAQMPGNSCCVSFTFLLPNPQLPEHRVQGTAHLQCLTSVRVGSWAPHFSRQCWY